MYLFVYNSEGGRAELGIRRDRRVEGVIFGLRERGIRLRTFTVSDSGIRLSVSRSRLNWCCKVSLCLAAFATLDRRPFEYGPDGCLYNVATFVFAIILSKISGFGIGGNSGFS